MVSNPNRELFYQSGISKNLKIYVKEDDYDSYVLFTITNSQLHSEQFELTESVCSEKEMKFGCCESAMVKFRVSDDVPQLIDKWLKIDIVVNNDEQNPVSLGYFKVSSDTPSKNNTYRDVTAYDFMQDVFDEEYVTEWYNDFDEERTPRNLRTYFGLFCGISASSGNLPNDDVELDFSVDMEQENLSGYDIMSAIAEINGAFVKIDRDRKMKYLIPKYEGDADGAYSRNHYSFLAHENFQTSTIDYIRIISSKTGMDIHYPSTVTEEIPKGFNVYTIKDNFLLEGQTQEKLLQIAQNLYDEVRYIYYTPLEIQGIGDPCIESGDMISVVDTDANNPIFAYVFKRTLKGIQSLMDNITCDGVYKYARVSFSVNSEVETIKATTESVKQEVQTTQASVTTLTTRVETVEQNVSSNYMLKNNPVGSGSFSMNRNSESTIGRYSHAEGYDTTASGYCSHAEGWYAIASGDYSHAEGGGQNESGDSTEAFGDYSHAEGDITHAMGFGSHAEGGETRSNGDYSHAEGLSTTAEGDYSHVEGLSTTAEGESSHAEGSNTTASGYCSHAEGSNTTASGYCSHAEGSNTTASGCYSNAEGFGTIALDWQSATGMYNDISTATAATSEGATTGTAVVIGCGTHETSRANAFRVQYDGKIYATNSTVLTGADYAEYFEWADGNPNAEEDRVGYFVTLDENNPEKIRIANEGDYILGIISGMPSVVGNGDECWNKRYILDDFGRYVLEESVRTTEDGNEMKVVTKKQNPDYEPGRSYIPRNERPEWDAVGMLGALSVYDDGTCQVNGYCKCANGGIATRAEDRGYERYRVISRVKENIVKVVLK